MCVCLLFLSAQRRTLNYLDINIHTRVEKKWKQNKNKNKRMNVWLSRRFAENGPKWDRIIKKTHRNKLNRETMLKKPLLFEPSPTNENPFQNQSISTHVLFDLRSRLLLLLRYYINIICWLTNINIVFFSSSFFLYIRLVSFAATFFTSFRCSSSHSLSHSIQKNIWESTRWRWHFSLLIPSILYSRHICFWLCFDRSISSLEMTYK